MIIKYQIIENIFVGLRQVKKKDLTWTEAKYLAERWNNETDCYYTYDIQKMKPTIKELRKEKLKKIFKK